MSKKTLILLLVLIVVIAASAKKSRAPQRSEWHGLTESQARSKLDAKLPDKIPAEKRSAISDKVVGKMRERGVIVDDDAGADAAGADAGDAAAATS
ncbi:MAG: hypothetical protein ACR2O6_10530 [Ilumatobacteraceae bacterium]